MKSKLKPPVARAPADHFPATTLIARALLCLGVFFPLPLLASANASEGAGDPAYLAQVLNRVDSEKIFERTAWHRLLFIRKEWIGGPKGMFDDPAFYLAGPAGKTDPRLEMIGSLKAFFAPEIMQVGKEQARHPQCVFPARWSWLKKNLNLDTARFPERPCPEVARFLKFADYERVSLVFSNYFADNPGSLFGHTLLRLHRREEAKSEVGLLDDAANFSAMVPVMNPLTYPFQGLFGFFQGRFALLPYSQKIQEYNNYESRDLWEYDLKLTAEEIQALSALIWEVGHFHLNYYYLDENCSFIILALLEAVRPSLELTDHFHLYAIPADTVKAVTRTPGLVGAISYKASAQSRFLERAHALNPEESALFLKIAGRFEASYDAKAFDETVASCDDGCRVRLYDALIEFIDFKEKKISIKELKHFVDLRRAVLVKRAQIHERSPALVFRPDGARPDLGHLSAFWEIQTGWTDRGLNRSDLRWRPALHDLNSSSIGYTNQLEIQVMDTVLRWDQERGHAFLQRFSLLELTSLGHPDLALNPASWHFELAYANDSTGGELFGRTYLETALGRAFFIDRLVVYGMINLTAGYSEDPGLFWHFGLGPRLGAVWNLSERFIWTASYNWTHDFGASQKERAAAESRFSVDWRNDQQSFVQYRYDDRRPYWGLGHRVFF